MMKVTVWIDGTGRTTATTYTTPEKKANLKIKGFQPFTSFNVPKRYFNAGKGWYPAYIYFVKWAVHNLGI